MTTARDALNSGDPRQAFIAIKKMAVGDMLSLITVTATGLTAAAAHDVTSAVTKAASTIGGITLGDDENLPAIGQVIACRSTGGAAATAARVATDSAATPAAGAVVVSADRKTITFEGTATGFVLQYYAAPVGGGDQDIAVHAP